MMTSRPATNSSAAAAVAPMRLLRERTRFLCVDIQERLATAMPEEFLYTLQKNALVLLRGAAVLNVPVIVSEQYKKGLGELLPDLAAALPAGTPRFDKLSFSAYADAAVAAALPQPVASSPNGERPQIVVFGMETHICVYQTVRDLCHAGFAVYVPHDAVCSRHPENLRVGLILCERAGATVTSTETILFDLLGSAGTAEFKAISALVK